MLVVYKVGNSISYYDCDSIFFLEDLIACICGELDECEHINLSDVIAIT